jgi:hypothetical protein
MSKKSIVGNYRNIKEAEDIGYGGGRNTPASDIAESLERTIRANFAGVFMLGLSSLWRKAEKLNDILFPNEDEAEVNTHDNWVDESGRDGDLIFVDYYLDTLSGHRIRIAGELKVSLEKR